MSLPCFERRNLGRPMHHLAMLAGAALLLCSMPAMSMDIDIFNAQNTAGAAPNVLIVLDNTSNWARQNQHWPGGIPQGQAEADAIKTVIQSLPGSINIGLLELVTGGPATDNGGYVRYAISPVGQAQGSAAATNRANFSSTLTTIYNNINSPTEKQNSNVAYGNFMYDAYNYFAGARPFANGADVVASLADTRGYTTTFSQFKSPLSADTGCANNYIIFIGNPNASGPASDDNANTTALASLGGATSELKLPQYIQGTQMNSTNLGYSAACYTTAPSGTPTDYASQCPNASSTYDSCSFSATDTTTALPTCATGTQRYSVVADFSSGTVVSTTTNTNQPTGGASVCIRNQPADPACPSTSSVTSGSQTTTTAWSACTYTTQNTSCSGGRVTWNPVGTTTVTVTATSTSRSTLGNSLACSSSVAGCTTAGYTCPTGSTCSCSSAGATTGGSCPSGARYQVTGNSLATVTTPTGTFATDTQHLNADEWARFLYQNGIPVSGAHGPSSQTVATYTIDVYHDQPNALQSGLLASMARAGGGKYFTATNEQAIITALQSIFGEIQAVNSTFASASLPISATNRAQNDNQVYIGMFRPDATDHPRWFGNLKRYQFGVFNGYTDLADLNGNQAVSSTTGFITPCATSWWTTDSGSYWYDTANSQSRIFITQATTAGTAWQTAGDDTNFAKGLCGTTGTYSDLPDGPTVEKGGAAEMLRQQTRRTVKTLSSSNALVDFTAANVTGLSVNSTVNNNILNFIRGLDVTGEVAGTPSASARPSIHGDVVHSRPLPVDYGGTNGVVIFYGAGDGAYRAVDANTGQEKWAFVAPESYGTFQRLLDNTPLIQTPSPTPPGGISVAGTTPKDFFFDGSTGLYQNADNSSIWIYPAMRRGGRMLHAFDVSTPASPRFKWKVGCPSQGSDAGCTSNMSGIGQTWSTPSPAFLTGYSSSAPVVIVGGGYDTCEDTDSATSTCSSPKGAVVYVLDAGSGTVVKSFSTDRSVASDVALVDINLDGTVDAAYVADTGGNLYRIDFADPASNFTARGPMYWSIAKVAYTHGRARKFLFAPAVLPYRGSVYVAIGSGDREHPLAASYPYTTPVVNRFYVYLDNPSRSDSVDLDGDRMLNYSDSTQVNCQTAGVLPGARNYGWYMDLTANGTGEQTVTSALIIGGMTTFSTNRPVPNSAACTTALGEARGYFVNLLNGSGSIGVAATCGGARSGIFVGGGLPPTPVAGTVTVNGKPKTVLVGAIQRGANTASSPLSGQEVRPPISSKRSRIYWRTPSDTR